PKTTSVGSASTTTLPRAGAALRPQAERARSVALVTNQRRELHPANPDFPGNPFLKRPERPDFPGNPTERGRSDRMCHLLGVLQGRREALHREPLAHAERRPG